MCCAHLSVGFCLFTAPIRRYPGGTIPIRTMKVLCKVNEMELFITHTFMIDKFGFTTGEAG
jgi:hypothetical protein